MARFETFMQKMDNNGRQDSEQDMNDQSFSDDQVFIVSSFNS